MLTCALILVSVEELHLIQGNLAGKLQTESWEPATCVSELPTFGITKGTKVKKAESLLNGQTGKFP